MLLQAIETNALKLAEKIIPFNFDQFEKASSRKAADATRIEFHFEEKIQELEKRNQITTASNYKMSMRSLKEFTEAKTKAKFSRLTFADITPDWLKDFEFFLTETKGRSITTASFYVRALRTLFNDAIAAKDIEQDSYPFGKRKYQTPSAKNSKRAMNAAELKILFEAEPKNKEQAKAKDFWFFSFACNGMNVKDIALMRWKDIQGDKLIFYRAKTINTSKSNLKPIVAYLNSFALEVIERYGNSDKTGKNFVFPILSDTDSAMQQRSKIQNFTRFINQHVKKMAIANGLPEGISTYWARHSFATTSIRKGASLELISESLGHGNLKTTQGYFAGFDSDTKKELAATLMEF
jgi:site-specific recombinase XerD